jgi:hypothetical protein
MGNGKGTVATKRRAAGKDSTGIYESSTDALKEINDAFDYWSGQITATSLQTDNQVTDNQVTTTR